MPKADSKSTRQKRPPRVRRTPIPSPQALVRAASIELGLVVDTASILEAELRAIHALADRAQPSHEVKAIRLLADRAQWIANQLSVDSLRWRDKLSPAREGGAQ